MKKVNFKNSMIALAIGLVMISCGGGNSNKQSGTEATETKMETAKVSSGQQLITNDIKTGEGSEARNYYYADTFREEFAFDRNGTLTDYKRIYTFVEGANKEKALEYITFAGFKASIEGNTLVVDGNGNYLGFPYSESNFAEIKERLDGKGTKYTIK
jgi:hypothetical protein